MTRFSLCLIQPECSSKYLRRCLYRSWRRLCSAAPDQASVPSRTRPLLRAPTDATAVPAAMPSIFEKEIKWSIVHNR